MSGVSNNAAKATWAQLAFGQKVKLTTTYLKEQALAWLSTPMGMATAAVASIAILTSAISHHNQKIKEQRQELIKLGKEAADANGCLASLIDEYKKLGEDGLLDNSDREQAYEIQQKINELLGDEADKINLSNGEYKEQLELLRQILYANANRKYATISEAKTSAEKELNDAIIKNSHQKITFRDESKIERFRDYIQFIQGGDWDTIAERREIKKLLTNEGFEHRLIDTQSENGKSIVGFEIDTSSYDAIIESYEDALALRNIIAKEYSDNEYLQDFSTDLKSFVTAVETSISQYKEAIEDYNINQAIIEFNETEFDVSRFIPGMQSVKGAFIESKEAMSGWILAMTTSESISDGVQQKLISLAKTYYPQYINVINEAIEAQGTKAAKDALVDKSISDNIDSLKEEAKALGITESKMIELILTEIKLNEFKLDVTQKVDALKELAVWAGVAQQKIDAIIGEGAGKSTWAERNGVEIIGKDHTNEKWTHNGQELYSWAYIDPVTGDIYDTIDELKPILLERAIQDEIEKFYNQTPSEDDPSGDNTSKPDLPETVETTPKEHKRGNSYSDFFDEILADRQKARETFEEKDEQLQKELERALEDLDLESAERIAQAISDNEAEYQHVLGEQLEQNQNALNNEILPAIFEIAPELKGKAWEDITEVDKEKIRQGLEQAKLDAENAIIDEENRLQTELDDLETQWNKDSYNMKSKNGNKEDEAYKQKEAEFKAKKDALEKDIDAVTSSDSPLQQALEAAEKQIEAWDGLTNSAEDYAEDIKEIPGLIDESQERIEQSSEDLKGGLDDLFSEYERHIDRQTDELQKQADAYDILINKAQALADGSKSMYDSLRNVRQLQRDISKELATNKALGEYLDEDTRKLLFNEDDYNKLSKKLSGISSDIAGISSWYANQINGLTEDNWYLEGAITAEYERRLAMKEKEYEIARAELDLEKKKQELNNILNEKNIRMLTKDAQGNYKWTQIHNVEEASRVAGEIAELEGQIAETRLQATEDSIVNQKQAEADALNAEKAAIEKRIELINKETEELATAVEDITNPLMDFGNLVTQLNAKLGLVTGVSTVRGGSSSSKTKTGGSTGRSEYAGTGWENVEYDPNTDYQAIINDAIARGDKLAAGEAEIKRNLKIEGEGLDIPKTYNYHTDPKKTFDQGGVAKGKGLMFKDTNYDELVLDPVQTGLFEKFIENTKGFDILAGYMNNLIKVNQVPFKDVSHGGITQFNGDIILPNVREPEDFMYELKKNLQHYNF